MSSLGGLFGKVQRAWRKAHAYYSYAREEGDSPLKALRRLGDRVYESIQRKRKGHDSYVYMECFRDVLEALPPIPPLAEGLVLRNYREGDEPGLARIFAASWLDAVTPEEVRKVVVEDPSFKPERVFVVEYHGRPVAAGLAYVYNDAPHIANPRYVSALPGFRGMKLGLVVSFAIMHYYKDQGFACLRYATHEWRESALKLFFGLGFHPLLASEKDKRRWEAITQRFGHPEVMAKAKWRETPAGSK